VGLIVFYIFAGITLLAALGVVTTRNVVYAALFLLVSLSGVAGLFVILFAEFLALVQLLIYGGAVIIVRSGVHSAVGGVDRRDRNRSHRACPGRRGRGGMNLELVDVQILASALFCLGLYGVLARRSAVMILMSVELMLNAVNVNLVAFSAFRDISAVTGQVIVIFVITVAAAEVGLALAVIMRLFRSHGSVNVDEIDLMKG
jgi:NADH-quinone oxidoreductase subunit K